MAALKSLGVRQILYQLNEGAMVPMAAGLSSQEKLDVAQWLATAPGAKPGDDWAKSHMCAGAKAAVDLSQPATVANFGFGLTNQRKLAAKEAGLTTDDLKRLKLKWAIGMPGATSMRGQPAIVGDTLFLPVQNASRVYALDAETACVKWVREAEGNLRTSVSYGELAGRKALVFGDGLGQIEAIDARDGSLIWKRDIKASPANSLTGTPVIYRDRVYVTVSAGEVGRAAQDTYECCKSHGVAHALEGKTGAILWTAHMTPDAAPQGFNAKGVRNWGPSGAIIWSSPSIDEKRGLVYVNTGENMSLPVTDTSDAIIALDIATGAIKWKFQGVANDAWNSACRYGTPSGANCPDPMASIRMDFDFGGGPVLIHTAQGDVLAAGQKSGHVWGVDPATGKLKWSQRFGKGTTLGGVHWGIATDGTRIFAPINDPSARANRMSEDPSPGLNAIDAATGKVLWRYRATPDCSGDRKTRSPQCDTNFGLSPAPVVIDGAVLTGAVDGRMRIFDAKTGEVIFTYDTNVKFDTANGVAAAGGAMDSAPITAGKGMVFVSSGYSGFGQPGGNVLLAFAPEPRK